MMIGTLKVRPSGCSPGMDLRGSVCRAQFDEFIEILHESRLILSVFHSIVSFRYLNKTLNTSIEICTNWTIFSY